MIMANSATRVLSSAEIGRQAERVERLFYELKEAGYEFPGRMRDQVAKACNVSASKIARLKLIREKLSPSWMAKWEAGNLAEDTAYKLAQLPKNFQERLGTVLRKPTAEQISSVAEQYAAGIRWVNDKAMTCPEGTLCQHFNSFLLHDAKCYPYSRCHGKTCCLECRFATGFGACQSACSRAVAMRKIQKAEAEAKAETSRKRERTKLQKAMAASASRLVQALDAGDPVPDEERILSNWYGNLNAGDIRAIAAGTYDKWDKLHYSQDPLLPDRLDADTVRKLSLQTGASADWLMGLSDVMFPEQTASGAGADWQTGDPVEDGRYLCLVDMGDETYHEQRCEWADGFWTCYGRNLDGLFRVAAWYPLPPEWHHWMGVPGRANVTEEDDEQ